MKRVRRVVKPYPAIAEAAFVRADYPSCKLFLRCRETSGATLTDEVSGDSLTVGASVERNGNAVQINMRSVAQQVAEFIPEPFNPGANTMMLFAVFKHTGTGSAISLTGFASTEHSHMYVAPGAVGAHVNQDQSSGDSATITAPVNETLGIAVMSVPGATNGEVRLYKTTGSTWETETLPVLGFTSHNTYDQLAFAASGSGNLLLYALMAFQFTTPPPDIKPALLWMTAQALAGEAAVYPALRDRT